MAAVMDSATKDMLALAAAAAEKIDVEAVRKLISMTDL